MITIGIATIPSRIESLKDTVRSLKNQCDILNIHMNDNNVKYSMIEGCAMLHGKDLGDAAKFYFSNQNEGYFLSCDDDLIYPHDYIEKTIQAIDKYKCFVSWYGRILKPHPTSYYKDKTKMVQCLHDAPDDIYVHTGGTGVMGFDNRTIKIPFEETFPQKYKNMADINVALFAQKNKIPIMALAHEKGWIKHTTKIDMNTTIHAVTHKRDQLPTRRFNSIKDWKIFK